MSGLSSFLNEIAAHKDAWIPFAALLSGVAAVLSSIIASIAILVSLRTSRRTLAATITSAKEQLQANVDIAELNVRASVISANRQNWINALRTEIAHALMDLRTLRTQYGHLDEQQLKEILSDFTIRENMIHLLINPKEEDHQKLCEALTIALGVLTTLPSNTEAEKKFDELGNKILSISQKILKREWERVKQVV